KPAPPPPPPAPPPLARSCRAAARRGSGLQCGRRAEVSVLHLPRVIHHVVGGAAHEELDRPGPRRLAFGVVGAGGIQVDPPMPRASLRGGRVRPRRKCPARPPPGFPWGL